MSQHHRTWHQGRCPRGHDVTDQVNVRIVRRSNRPNTRACRTCAIERARAWRRGESLPPSPVDTWPPKACARCGEQFDRDGLSDAAWEARQFCSRTCSNARHVPPPRLSPDELARLRRDVGLPVDGAA